MLAHRFVKYIIPLEGDTTLKGPEKTAVQAEPNVRKVCIRGPNRKRGKHHKRLEAARPGLESEHHGYQLCPLVVARVLGFGEVARVTPPCCNSSSRSLAHCYPLEVHLSSAVAQ